jgi:ribosomal protein L12E/L44/L45/RPP1/RPP2
MFMAHLALAPAAAQSAPNAAQPAPGPSAQPDATQQAKDAVNMLRGLLGR